MKRQEAKTKDLGEQISPSHSGENRRLDSWKEIAAYLRRDVRTLQRWNIERGLPIRRLGGGKRSAVYAWTADIDHWLANQSSEISDAPVSSPMRSTRLRSTFVAALAVVALASTVILITILRKTTRAVSTAKLEGNVLVTFDATGSELWRHSFAARSRSTVDPRQAERMVKVADVDGDGVQEVVVVFHSGVGLATTESEIDCFSSKGALRWRLPLAKVLSGGEEQYRPPWNVQDMVIEPGHGGQEVWLVLTHEIWWPSLVLKIEGRTGVSKTVFVNGGWLFVLRPSSLGDKPVMLVGGFSNEYNSPVLAVLDKDMEAVSPQSNARYKCESCGHDGPLAYYVFPKSEVNKALPPMIDPVKEISLDGRGSTADLDIQSEESGEECCKVLYRFSQQELMPVSFSYDDTYWQMHDRLEAKRRLEHSRVRCDSVSKGVTVRRWTRDTGWNNVLIPYQGSR